MASYRSVDFSPVEEIVSDGEKNLARRVFRDTDMAGRQTAQAELRYMPECGKFLYWDKTRWRFDERGRIPYEVVRLCSEASAEALMKMEDKRSAERTVTRSQVDVPSVK